MADADRKEKDILTNKLKLIPEYLLYTKFENLKNTNKTYYDPAGNVVASGLSSATGRGGFVGAATDAQAATALQDRAAQNQAAQFNIDSMNRAADAMREARAARLGVGRGTLDRMEGRHG